MRRIIFILAILFLVSPVISLNESRTNFNNERLKYMQNLADNISSEAPIDVIIAFDSSASMVNSSNESKDIALKFLNLLEKKDNDNIKIGYVSWSHVVKSFEFPNKSYDIIKKKINKTTFDGNTCVFVGINKSIDMLNTNSSKGVKKAIVIISDGAEECNVSENSLRCSDLDNMLNSGISLYGISTTDSINDVLPCHGELKSSPYSPEIEIISDEIASSFVLQARGREIQIKEPNTNVTVTKKVEGGIYGPRIVLTMTVPPARDIKNALVLALDSSGSFGLGGRPDHGVIIRKAVPNVLAYAARYYPSTNISILSWDDNYDFAYSDLANRDPKKAKLVPIGQALVDLETNHVFNPADKSRQFPIPFTDYQFSLPFSNLTNPDYTERFYDCRENESTNLSIGVRGSIDILDANYPEGEKDVTDTAAKSIILVTGRSEFSECLPDIIEDARKREYRIYPVGLGVINESLMRTSLSNLAIKSGGQYQYSPNDLKWTEDAVRDDILNAIKETLMRTIVDDIMVKESLYPYLNIINIVVKSNGSIIETPFKNDPLATRKGQTWEMILKDGLIAGDILEIEINTEFNMNLPVDVAENMTPVDFNPEIGTAPSFIKYNWRDINDFTLPLPENRIII